MPSWPRPCRNNSIKGLGVLSLKAWFRPPARTVPQALSGMWTSIKKTPQRSPSSWDLENGWCPGFCLQLILHNSAPWVCSPVYSPAHNLCWLCDAWHTERCVALKAFCSLVLSCLSRVDSRDTLMLLLSSGQRTFSAVLSTYPVASSPFLAHFIPTSPSSVMSLVPVFHPSSSGLSLLLPAMKPTWTTLAEFDPSFFKLLLHLPSTPYRLALNHSVYVLWACLPRSPTSLWFP